MKKEELMRKAIELSIENVANGGGPFRSCYRQGRRNYRYRGQSCHLTMRPYRPCGSQRHPCGGKQTGNIQLERM